MAMAEGRLAGRRALITGAASGIGKATAKRFREEGAQLALLDRAGDALGAVAEETEAAAVVVDLVDPAATAGAVQQAAEALGGLDILVNNAGVGMVKRLHEYSIEEWNLLVDVNLNAVFHVLKPGLPLLLESGGGVVLMNGSGSAVRPTRGEAPYAAAKAGLITLVSNIAQEYGPAIRANCVSPGVIRTPMSEGLFSIDGLLDPFEQASPAGRGGTPEEVAALFAFLASDDAAYLNGQNIVLDGGGGLAQPGIDEVLRMAVPPLPGK